MPDGQENLQREEDVEEILRMAVREGVHGAGSLRERLEMSASELGISPEQLERAEKAWAEQKAGAAALVEERADRALFKKIKTGEFVQHLATYVAVNAFLAWIDLRGDMRIDWSYWPLLGWGIAIFIHVATLFAQGEDEEKEFQKWRKKRKKR